MMEWFNYLLKVSACSAFFFAFYLLVLRKLTFFKINRFYLLFVLLLSFVIPTLQFTVERELEAAPIIEAPIIAQNESLTEQLSLAPITAPVASLPVEEAYNWFNLLPFLYITVVFSLLGLATWRLFQLIKHAKQNSQEINGLKLVHKSIGFTNCSFFSYVFIDENSLTENELQIMLRHEEVHAKQYHSVDKIILIIAKAVLWFNPIVYFYDKALEQIHEYEADEVTSRNFGTTPYANLLLRLAVVKSDMPLVHNFVKSPIKERIKMLFNSKSKHMKKLLYLLALPIGMGLLWGFTVKVVEIAKVDNLAKKNITTKNILSLDEKLWGKTLKGKVKSILQTEVAEVLNFKYEKGVIRVYNDARGKVSVGDEVYITIQGTVNDITVIDAKGNVLKELDAPCYGMSNLTTKDGIVLYNMKIPGGISTKVLQNSIKIDTVLGKKLTGKVVSFGMIGKEKVFNLKSGDKIYPISMFKINADIKVGDDLIVMMAATISPPIPIGEDPKKWESIHSKKPVTYITTSIFATTGQKVYEYVPEYQAFGYETNKARYAWSKIKSINKSSDGTINKIVLNDKGFTINLNIAAQKFKSNNFKIGDSVVVKFFGEKLVAKNVYTTDQMIVLTSWPKKYELKNQVLYHRFYNENGKQKTNKLTSSSKTVNVNDDETNLLNTTSSKKALSKPILVSSKRLKVDNVLGLSYVEAGKYTINGVILEAKESTFNNRNNLIIANNATIMKNGEMIISEEILVNPNDDTFKVKEIKATFSLSTFKKIDLGSFTKLEYNAMDSTIVNKTNNTVTLYGNATIANEKMKFKGSEIVYNKKLNTALVKNAVLYDKQNTFTSALMEVDFNTSKVYSKKGVLKMNLKY